MKIFQFEFFKMKFVTIFLVLFIASVCAEKARFDNYRLYGIQVENEEQYKMMKYIEENSDSVK